MQSIGTFLFVSAVFAVVFLIAEIPVYLAFVFGGIALATAPAPALSIVNEYRTNGSTSTSPLAMVGMVILPFVIGIAFGFLASVLMKTSKNNAIRFCLLILFLVLTAISGLLIDFYLFHSFTVNFLLTGMAFSATVANLVPEKDMEATLKLYNPIFEFITRCRDCKPRYASGLQADCRSGGVYCCLYLIKSRRKDRRSIYRRKVD